MANMSGCSSCYMLQHHKQLLIPVLLLVIMGAVFPSSSSSQPTRRFHFNVEWTSTRRLCHTKQLLTVNGKFPGPTIAVKEGENVEVKVTNHVATNTTIHWHGVRQLRTAWADGPAYITQCPIGKGQSYTYKFTAVEQRGILLWHAHLSWQRASVYGAFIIYPRMPYPFSPPLNIHAGQEILILLGEWWNKDVDEVEKEMMMYGGGPNASDAYTINGLPGPLYPCSIKDSFIHTVDQGKTYMLRIINAALNQELFFAIANHTLTVVEIDAVYTKPFSTDAIMIAPGQTTTLLLTADQPVKSSPSTFAMAARPYLTSIFPFNNSTAIAFLMYKTKNKNNNNNFSTVLPNKLPEMKDTAFATQFTQKLRSLASPQYPCNVPKKVDKRVVTTISLNLQDCPQNQTCKGYAGKRFFASMNNQSFVRPSISILESHYRDLTRSSGGNSIAASHLTGSSFDDFPEKPPKQFDYTGVNPFSENMNSEFGTKLLAVPYGTDLEIVLQDTNFLNPENHPIHVHGHNFFVVGSGVGNFDAGRDPGGYNLVDPPERNTVAVPSGGWAAIRLKADNPGVWFIHCHLEEHTSWGLATAFLVLDGPHSSQCLLPPPLDLPSC
ncbi:laccase-1 [Malania oleifera]|uniref:laccase-1 n=1 Tax=Malania oleifera TaxID=397392 RepID=UPI0025AE3BCC|nr:laccase-1 [Malania oleifera]